MNNKTMPTPLRPHAASLFIFLVFATGCDAPHGHEHPHDAHGGHAHGEDPHGHDHGAHVAAEAVTRWGDKTQLFVEFPALVVGEPSPFAAHLTSLDQHTPVDEGMIVVELSGGGPPTERFVADAPTTPGIFRPVIQPQHPGTRRVTVQLTTGLVSEVHDLGELQVFSTREEASMAAAHDEGGEPISYLLERQWQVPFEVQRASARSIRPSLPAFATLLQPRDTAATLTAPRDGRLSAPRGARKRIGDRVAAGDVLFSITAAPQAGATPATLDLAIERASIEADAAQREVTRLTQLADQGVVPRRRLDEASSALASAEAKLKSARRQRASFAQTQRIASKGDTVEIPSPIDANVTKFHVSPGSWVSRGQVLAELASRDKLLLSVHIPEAYVGRVRNVSGAWFTLDGVPGGVNLDKSSLLSVGVAIDPRTRTLPVLFELDNTDGRLFAGMNTLANVVVDSPRQTVAIPLDALVDDAGADTVYVQTGGESFERRAVKLGARDGEWVEVVEGVGEDEWVVSEGAYLIKLASTSTESVGHGHAH